MKTTKRLSTFDQAERKVFETRGAFRVLAIPDTHHPFANYEKISKLQALIKEFKPTHIIQLGDLYDCYTFSRFSRSINFITPEKELLDGKQKAKEMWEMIGRSAPRAKKYQLLGNHERRMFKKLLTQAPEFESIVAGEINELFTFKGVESFTSDRSELIINGIVFMHGYSTTPGYHMRYFLRPVVHGHTHRGGVVFEAIHEKALFELDCGNLVDTTQTPFQYTETKTNKWLAGVGIIDDKGPRFVTL